MDNMISTLDEGHCSLIEQILILLTKNVFSLKLDEWFWRESKKSEKVHRQMDKQTKEAYEILVQMS